MLKSALSPCVSNHFLCLLHDYPVKSATRHKLVLFPVFCVASLHRGVLDEPNMSILHASAHFVCFDKIETPDACDTSGTRDSSSLSQVSCGVGLSCLLHVCQILILHLFGTFQLLLHLFDRALRSLLQILHVPHFLGPAWRSLVANFPVFQRQHNPGPLHWPLHFWTSFCSASLNTVSFLTFSSHAEHIQPVPLLFTPKNHTSATTVHFHCLGRSSSRNVSRLPVTTYYAVLSSPSSHSYLSALSLIPSGWVNLSKCFSCFSAK